MKTNTQTSASGGRRGIYGLRGGLLLAGFLVSWGAAAGGTVTFTTNLLQSACAISFINGASSTGNAITQLNLGDVKSGELRNCGGNSTACISTPSVPVTLKLSGCGIGRGSTTPTVSLSGINALTTDVTDYPAGIAYKFRDAGDVGGTSREYFVMVGKTPTVQYDASANGVFKAGDEVLGGNQGTGAAAGMSGEGAYRTLYLVVSCGIGGCSIPHTRGGTLSASLTFDFKYK